MINVPKPEVLRAAFANMRANLAHWNQERWVFQWDGWFALHPSVPPEENICRTTACLAGHIVLANGASWEELLTGTTGIDSLAMEALGYTWEEQSCFCGDPECSNAGGWDGDGDVFELFFGRIFDQNGNVMHYDQAQLERFAAEVSEATGVEL